MFQLIIVSVSICAVYLSYKCKENCGYALGLMWSMYSFEQLLQQGNAFLVANASFINIGFTAVAGVALLAYLAQGGIGQLQLVKTQLLAYFLLVLAGVSILWSVSPSDTSEQLSNQLPYLIAFVGICPLIACEQRHVEAAIRSTIFFGGLLLVGLAYSKTGSRGVLLETTMGHSVEANPLAAASYAGTVLICCAFSLYAGRENKLLSLVKIAVCVIALWVIVRSGSRGQMVALAVSCFVILPMTARLAAKRSVIIPLVLVGLFCVVSILLIEQSKIGGRWQWENLKAARIGRFEMAQRMLEEYSSSGMVTWLFGLGSSSSFKIVGFYPHIVPAEVLAELGIFGFGLFAAFSYYAARAGLKSLRSEQLFASQRVIVGTLFSIYVFHAALTLKQGSLLGSTFFLCNGVSLAILASSLRQKTCYSTYDGRVFYGAMGSRAASR